MPIARLFAAFTAFRWTALILVVALPLCGALFVRQFEARLGLTGTYFHDPDWQRPAFTVVDTVIGPRELRPRFAVFGRSPFSVTWQGFLAIDENGVYDFVTRSDQGSTVQIDGSMVVDNSGSHGSRARAGTAFLSAGFHAIRLTFQQFDSGGEFRVSWRAAGRGLEPFPRTALWHGPRTSWPVYRLVTWARTFVLFMPFVWIGLLEIWLLRRFARPLWRFVGRPSFPNIVTLVVVVTVSTALNVLGLNWGLPGDSWAPDEVFPVSVFEGVARRFGTGWYGNYPPFHFFLLALAYLPFWGVSLLTNTGREIFIELVWLNRLVCVHMAAATLVVVYAMAQDVRGALAGLIAAAATALLPAFVYYAKISNLEVPYTFWSLCALAFYGRAVMHGASGDYWRFALFATVAVCTKDQAYGLFVLPTAHLAICRAWKIRHDEAHRWWHVAVDPTLGRALLVALLTFAVGNNLLWNWSGFVGHVKILTLSKLYRVFPATPQGELQLLSASLAQVRWLFGWPMTCAVVFAVLTTLFARKNRGRLWLLSPIVSYYAFFVALVFYSYDRFYLAVAALLAVLVGCWAEDLRERVMRPRLRLAVTAAACVVAAYTFAYAASVDAMMLFDARYRVEDWITANVPLEATIGTAGFPQYLPRISPVQRVTLDAEGLGGYRPEFVVVNGEHMRRYPPETDLGRLFAALKTGSSYRQVLQHKTAIPFAPFASQTEVANRFEDWFTNLDKINPEILVFQRIEAGK